jgi:hypothetical protein
MGNSEDLERIARFLARRAKKAPIYGWAYCLAFFHLFLYPYVYLLF